MAHVSEIKKQKLAELKKTLSSSERIGIIDLTSLPSAQLQKLKHKLKDDFEIRVYNKSLVLLALESLKDKKQNIQEFEKYLDNCIPAILTTKKEPFQLSRLISKNKSSAAAKSGQTAPRDIEIKAGPTKFTPGPIIGELGQAGIKAAIEAGKVVIKKDVQIAKKGDVLTQKQVDLLAKFSIEPMEIGLSLVAVYDNGHIYDSSILNIDEKHYISSIQNASTEAFNLAMFIAYPTSETISLLVQKAANEAIALDNFRSSKESTKTDEVVN